MRLCLCASPQPTATGIGPNKSPYNSDGIEKAFHYPEPCADRGRARTGRWPPRPRGASGRRAANRPRGAQRSVIGQRDVELSAKEFALLRALAAEPTRVFTKEELLRDVWGFKLMGTSRRSPNISLSDIGTPMLAHLPQASHAVKWASMLLRAPFERADTRPVASRRVGKRHATAIPVKAAGFDQLLDGERCGLAERQDERIAHGLQFSQQYMLNVSLEEGDPLEAMC